MKKIFKVLSVLILSVSLSASLSYVAAQDIGTYEDGIKPESVNYSQYSPLFKFDTFPNADFEQGFKYWQTDSGEYPSACAKIKEENGNHFVELNAGKAWNGICSVRFNVPQPKVGDSFVLLYDWRGDKDAIFDVTLIQWSIDKDTLHGHGIRMGYGNGALLSSAKNGGFNTSMTTYNHQSLDPLKQNDIDEMYFSYSLQLAGKADKSIQLDNLRFCRYESETGTVTDLDGKELFTDVKNEGSNMRTLKQVADMKNPPIYDTFPEYSFWDKLGFFFKDYGTIFISAVVLTAAVTTFFILKKRRENA